MNQQQPSVGRIVHIVDQHDTGDAIQQVCTAAIITAVNDTTVELTAFPPNHLPVYVRTPRPYDEAHSLGTWHWPERVDTLPPAPAVPTGIIPRPDHTPGPDVP